MVFGLFASAVTSGASFVFPTFASYKAIKANDISQLTPWLMFWSVQASLLFLEHWTYFVLSWLPLYKEVKMIFVLWMVLPQTQGSTYLYLHYLHPNLARHEHDIDRLIVRMHDYARSRGGQYLQLVLSWAQEILFGSSGVGSSRSFTAMHAATTTTTPVRTTAESIAGNDSYVSSLFARFRTVPVGAQPDTIPSTLLGFLSMSGKQGGDIIPSNLNLEERHRYVEVQKSKLNEWLQMLDAAAASYPPVNVGSRTAETPTSSGAGASASSGIGSRRVSSRIASGVHSPSDRDSDYEDVGADESVVRTARPTPVSSGSWFWKSRKAE